MIFCIKKQSFFKKILFIGEKNLFFSMCSSLSFTFRSILLLILLVNSSRCFSPCKYYLWKSKSILPGTLNVYSKNWFLTIGLLSTFIIEESDLFCGTVSSVPFTPRILVFVDSRWKY